MLIEIFLAENTHSLQILWHSFFLASAEAIMLVEIFLAAEMCSTYYRDKDPLCIPSALLWQKLC